MTPQDAMGYQPKASCGSSPIQVGQLPAHSLAISLEKRTSRGCARGILAPGWPHGNKCLGPRAFTPERKPEVEANDASRESSWSWKAFCARGERKSGADGRDGRKARPRQLSTRTCERWSRRVLGFTVFAFNALSGGRVVSSRTIRFSGVLDMCGVLEQEEAQSVSGCQQTPNTSVRSIHCWPAADANTSRRRDPASPRVPSPQKTRVASLLPTWNGQHCGGLGNYLPPFLHRVNVVSHLASRAATPTKSDSPSSPSAAQPPPSPFFVSAMTLEDQVVVEDQVLPTRLALATPPPPHDDPRRQEEDDKAMHHAVGF
ncbi:hypothetical protein BDK51DRAFT_52274 [Blyttiomyces helicus]|uniref:Uncharacterized protein n=1 Tax=Blyttiomyces helicus TaxID=388810 RepID=A0A4P9VZS6_9FUNG|nr:hypothetical protein BDK51DRAFT_52274 [Blyttiomyces helicus]|eukprot:RKO83790.1 hypothetical protein BDK51DRAFT_52274 [Blyttiomyces helicus]